MKKFLTYGVPIIIALGLIVLINKEWGSSEN